MKDRLAKYPGRYTAIVDTEKIEKGVPFNIEIARDDEPTVEGTPYNKESVLPDSVAEAICPDVEDPTPADVFNALHTKKAPAGFGYGGEQLPVVEGTTTDAINAGILELIKAMPPIFCTRQFKCKNPVTGGGHLYGTIYKQNDTNAVVVLYQLIYRYELRGQYTQGVWEEWEWSNPPISLNTEYRTTERFNDKPVYVKFLSCGALPNATTKNVFVRNNIADIVRVDGYLKNTAGYTSKVPIHTTTAVVVSLSGSSNLVFTTTTDQSTWDAYVAVYYTLDA